jgi:tRNA dimethylallyltransferase
MHAAKPPPLLIIAGPTASGKSNLALDVAERLAGEIISADAFAIYRGMDIGTDKPSAADRARVPHHLVDIADPGEEFSAGAFAKTAAKAIADIEARGRLAIVAGGTHFWIRALVVGLFPSPRRDPEVGATLAAQWEADPEAVFDRLASIDPDSAQRIGPRDRQRILRAIEIFELTGETMTKHWKRHRRQVRFSPLFVAPNRTRQELYARIDARAKRLFTSGLVEEVERILASGVAPDAHALKAIGYRQVVEMLEGKTDLPTAIDNTKRSSRKFAKRQLTWLRRLREGTVHWVAPVEEGGTPAVIDLWQQHTEGRESS